MRAPRPVSVQDAGRGADCALRFHRALSTIRVVVIRRSAISQVDYERSDALDPDTRQPAVVLAAVKVQGAWAARNLTPAAHNSRHGVKKGAATLRLRPSL